MALYENTLTKGTIMHHLILPVTKMLAGFAAGQVVGTALRNLVPTATFFQKIVLGVGTAAIGLAVGHAIDNAIDKLVEDVQESLDPM